MRREITMIEERFIPKIEDDSTTFTYNENLLKKKLFSGNALTTIWGGQNLLGMAKIKFQGT